MSSQRRVTAPPENKVEVVTDSLRQDSLGMPAGTETDSIGKLVAAPVSPHKEFRRIPSLGSRAFAQAFSDLILPGFPGVEHSISSDSISSDGVMR
jgi:hypothetical protein